MTGRELIERIHELGAEDEEVWFQPEPGYAYKKVRKVEVTIIGWSKRILGLRG